MNEQEEFEFRLRFEKEQKTSPIQQSEDKVYQDYVKKHTSKYQSWKDNAIPGAEIPKVMTKDEWKKDLDEQMAGRLAAIPETALSLGTGALAQIPATVYGLGKGIASGSSKQAEKSFGEALDAMTYVPRYKQGRDLVQSIGVGLQAFGPNPYTPSFRPPKVKQPSVIENLQKQPIEQPPVAPAPVTMPETLQVTPEGQAMRPDDAQWRDRATQMAIDEKEFINRYQAELLEAQMTIDNETRGSSRQMELFDQPEQGRMANPYEAALGDWRVDENGIPIKADLSMEAANVQAPLQRNLWGDELPRTRNPIGQAADLEAGIRQLDDEGQGSGRNLTDAIDSIPDTPFKGDARDVAMQRLQGAVEPSNELLAAMAESRRRGGKQSGALDWDAFTKAVPSFAKSKIQYPVYHGSTAVFDELKSSKEGGALGNGVYTAVRPEYASSYAEGKGGNVHQVYVNIQNPLIVKGPGDPMINALTALGVDREKATRIVEKAYDDKGYVTNEVKSRATKAGYDGIVQFRGETPSEIVPFAATQVKSAISPTFTGLARNQRGALDVDAIAKAAKSIGKSLASIGEKPMKFLSPKEELVVKNVGDNSYIPKGDAPEKIITDALKEQDGPDLNKWVQSGLTNFADKVDSALARGVARWLNYGEKLGNKYFNERVKPLEKAFGDLPKQDLSTLMKILTEEMFARRKFSPEELRAAGATEKTINTYQMLRDSQTQVLNVLNDSRQKLGMEPITEASAYFSSMWNGNYHVPIYDKNGKLIWYIKTETRGEANKAIKWIADNHANTVNASKLKPEYRPQVQANRMPRDVTNTFENMLEVFKDTPMEAEMRSLMEEYRKEQAFGSKNFKVHFETKANIRGFLGDRPWLSDKENAIQGAKAQIQYMKDAYKWAPMQEAMANIKEVLANPELIEQQPNNMAMTKMYVGNALGVTNNIMKNAESAVAQALGVSPSNLASVVGDAKTLMYLKQLGFSAGYAIATPLQAFILGPAFHLQLTGQGLKHNVMKSASNSMLDTFAIMAAHEVQSSMGDKLGSKVRGKLSPLGQEALRYMEDNGIINVNLFDEYANLGTHKTIETVKQMTGWTISFPEKIARTATFMSFVHHLTDSNFKGTKLDLFRKAEELTDNTLTKFSRSARPLVADAMGLTGELAYTYKSPMFNYYNNMSLLARDGKRSGNYKPFAAALLMTGVLGGVLNLPGIQELEGMLELGKTAIAAAFPGMAPKMDGVSIKQAALRNLPDVATYGVVSAATGSQMATRFSTQTMDVGNPLRDAFPASDLVSTAGDIGKAVISPTSTNAYQAAYSVLPPALKGILETTADTFESRSGVPYNPNRLSDREVLPYKRNESDVTKRRLGLYSLDEAKAKESMFLNSREEKRLNDARKASMTKMYDAIVRGDKASVESYAQDYVMNGGDSTMFERDLENKIGRGTIMPQDRTAIRAKRLNDIKSIIRQKELEGK